MHTPLQLLKSEFFRVLAHPTRIRILERLVSGERTVRELQGVLGLDQPIVSQHLAVLRGRGVVTVRREGALAHYGLASPLIAEVLKVSRDFLNVQLTESGSVLRELRREARG
jgi:ArsR family transcriptional regulator